MRTLILGAGLAGLSAALELARRGVEVMVVERAPGVGGLASTISHGEFRYDLGPHRFHTENPGILRFVEDLPGVRLEELSRVSRIRLLDRYFDYPLSLGNVLSKMPPARGAGMLLSFLWEKTRGLVSRRDQSTFQGWVMSRFGRGLYQLYLAPYNRKLWGIEPSQLSADWASQRITVPSLAGLVRETVAPSKKTVRSLVSTFHYPRGGIGMISRGLLRGVQEAGGRIITGTEPLGITKEGSFWKVGTSEGTITSDSLISTIPVDRYVSLLGDMLPGEVHEAAGELRFRGLVFLSVLLNGEVPHGDHWIYTSEDRYPFNRLSISRNFDPGSPSQVIFEFSCQEGDELWGCPMERLLEQTVPGAEHLGLFTRGMIRGASIHREPEAYPIYDLNYRRASRTVLDALELLEGSVTCGRQGLFRYNNMDHSIEMGRCAALETLGEGSVRENFDWSPHTWADG